MNHHFHLLTVDSPAAATSRRPAFWPRNRRHAFTLAWLLWIVPMLVIAALVLHDPLKRTVTLGSYHKATEYWWARQNLYVGPGGMNYLPHFVVLFSPFHFLPLRVGEILWRFCAAATLAAGLWRLVRELFGAESRTPDIASSVVRDFPGISAF